MKKNILIIFAILTNFIYLQCNNYTNQQDCVNNSTCDWVENITNWNCGNFGNSSTCENYSEYGCSWEFSWGGWQNYGSYCAGGLFQIDNGYCEEIEMLECSEMNQLECSTDDSCEWVEDIEWGNCSNYNNDTECGADDNCDWECSQWGSWYTWLCYGTYYCAGGNYQINNSYCGETQMPECSELGELGCSITNGCEWIEESVDCENISSEFSCNNNDCDWIEDIESDNCSNYNNSSSCNSAHVDCYWDLCYGGYYGSWSYCCRGGSFQIDNSYCDGENGYCQEESWDMLGDMNFDDIINIQDIIQIVDLVLNSQYNQIADMNYDSIVNVIDIIFVVDIILNS